MLTTTFSGIFYLTTVLCLFFIDYLLGNGFIDTFQRFLCKIVCVVRKFIREEGNAVTGNEYVLNVPVLMTEIIFLGLTIMFLKKYKHYRGKDRIDDLLQESREALRQTNEFLEKWRLRRINRQKPTEYSYLDDEPQKIKPFKLEVPILHMAIVDTIGTSKNQLERGDAGDTTATIDSTVLSMTSLLDDDLRSIHEMSVEDKNNLPEEIALRDRYLWDVLEDDFEE